jgi:hypothetical protein
MLIDAFAVEGVTELAVDSIFMMPHLGVLSTVHPAAATEVFEKDCLVHLGTCVAPVGGRPGRALLEVSLGGRTERLAHGELRLIPLPDGERVEAGLAPARGVDVGAGPGKPLRRPIRGGVVGLVLDGRGRRPLAIPAARAARVAAARAWSDALGLYPAA